MPRPSVLSMVKLVMVIGRRMLGAWVGVTGTRAATVGGGLVGTTSGTCVGSAVGATAAACCSGDGVGAGASPEPYNPVANTIARPAAIAARAFATREMHGSGDDPHRGFDIYES